jgi:ribosomal protein S8
MPMTATLEPLLVGDDSGRLHEELSQAAWIVLVGTADRFMLECLRGLSAPVLVVEPDHGLLQERAEASAAFGLQGIVLQEQVVGANSKEVCWYRYNDARLNGLEPLAALKPRYPNLSLESIEVRQQISLAQLLQAWEPALVDGGVLVLPEQAGLDWLDGAVSCLQRLRALCWERGASWSTPSQQHLEAVLADSWLVSQMEDMTPQPLLQVWRRDPVLHFQATVLVERDHLLKEVKLLEYDKSALVAERDGVMAEREALSSQLAVLEGEKIALVAERDGVMAEREALSSQLAVLEGEKIALVAERDGVMAEREALSSQLAVLEGEKITLVAERDGVMAERESLSSQVAVLEERMAAINNELGDLLDSINQQVAESANLEPVR